MRLLLLVLFPFAIHAQQVLLMSGKCTVPIPVSGAAITNTTSGLVNWWKMDENTGTTTADSKGSATGSAGSFTFPSWTSGKIGSALSFNGSTEGLQLAANTAVGTGAFTVSAWVNPDISQDPEGAIIYDSDDDSTGGYFFELSNGEVSLEIAGSIDNLRRANALLQAGVWTHILATYNGSFTSSTACKIYTNGVECTDYDISQAGTGSHAANSTTERTIGTEGANRSSSFYFGKLDDVRVWSRVLSAGEIQNMYQWSGQP